MAAPQDPIERFRELLAKAERNGEPEHGTAMTLATTSSEGRPSARMVLLKGLDERGFVFYTNYESRKAAELESTKFAALVFHWPTLVVQVRVEGPVARVDAAESDAYFASRVRHSQLGAWASQQSQTLDGGRAQLVTRYLRKKAQLLGRGVPRPPFWGGYRVTPRSIEFWVSHLGRLHDRYRYDRVGAGWDMRMLYP